MSWLDKLTGGFRKTADRLGETGTPFVIATARGRAGSRPAPGPSAESAPSSASPRAHWMYVS